jgi:hypothetical protein
MLTKRAQYHRSLDECQAKAEHACEPEISALWSTIAASYRFLMEREDRLANDSERDRLYPFGSL